MKRLHTLIVIVLVLAAIIGGIWLLLPDREATYTPAPTPTVVEPTYPTPPIIQAVANRLGIPIEALSHIDIQVPPDSSSCSTSNLATAVACHGFHSITFPATRFNEPVVEQNRSFAHEYLHEVWANMSTEEKNALAPAINQAYQAHANALNERLSGYTIDDVQRLNELHSFICTEMADSEIPEPLRSHCVQYVPNRAGLPSYY